MSSLQFVHEVSFGQNGQRPKVDRAKHACNACKQRKAKCTGIKPCDWCSSRNTPCIFEDSRRKRRKASRDSDTSKSTCVSLKPFVSKPCVPSIEDAQQFHIHSTSDSISTGNGHIDNSALSKTAKTSVTSRESQSLAQHISPPEHDHNATLKTQATFSHPLDQKSGGTGGTAVTVGIQGLSPGTSLVSTSTSASVTTSASDYFPANSPERQRRLSSHSTASTALTAAAAVQQPYFRWLGPTAIAPPVNGIFRLLSVNISSSSENRMLLVERQDSPCLSPDSLDQNVGEQSYKSDEVPLPPTSLYKEFYQSMANFVPLVPYEVFKRNYEEGTVCECKLYAMGAMAQRIVKPMDDSNLSEKYADMAKKLVIPHLAAPTNEIVFTLLLIAYLEFAHDRDSGLWAWSGMAIRMCYDLGLHKDSPIDDHCGRQIFWSVVCLDRQISCGTGRKATIPDEDIEHAPDLSAVVSGTAETSARPDPFPYLCKLMLLLGRVSNCLNSLKDTDNSNTVKDKFAQCQKEVSDFYMTLPSELLFDVQNFQEYARLNCSQVFLELHIWNQALVLAVHHPSLVYPRCQVDALTSVPSPFVHLTGTGAISIADMVTFADLIDSRSFLACPMMSQPILMAASAALSLFKPIKPTSPSLPAYTLQRTYDTCKKILDRMQQVWGGISWHRRMLDSLAASEADVDLSVGNVNIRTTDLGILRKASVDEATRKWVAEKIQSDQENNFIHGLFISGTIRPSPDAATPHANGTSNITDRFYAIEDNLRNAVINGMDLGEFF